VNLIQPLTEALPQVRSLPVTLERPMLGGGGGGGGGEVRCHDNRVGFVVGQRRRNVSGVSHPLLCYHYSTTVKHLSKSLI